MQNNPLHPLVAFKALLSNRYLIWQLAKREVIGRYKGSFLGLAWSFLNPLLMLVVYTFVFGVVFKARWGISPDESKAEFALALFCGLIAFNLFAENVTRAPGLILANAIYVKKVVFPLEILPVSILGASLIHGLISVIILMIGVALIRAQLPWTFIYLPFVLLPLLLASVGLSWFLASLGVFIRDLQQVTGIAVQVLMFLSPVFYPVTALPEAYQTWMLLNPLSSILENFRRVLIWNMSPEWHWLMLQTAITAVFAYLGYLWFQKTRKAFADVI